MKSSLDISSINRRATELFVQHLALSSLNSGSGKETSSLSHSHLTNTTEENQIFHFLTDILPKKILVWDYLKSNANAAHWEQSESWLSCK